MKAGKFTSFALAGLTLVCMTGCVEEERDDWVAVNPGSSQGSDVTLYRDVQFADIPVPQEYTLLPGGSHSFQGGLFRNGVLKYQGPLEWTAALDFYRVELSAAGWKLENTERGFDVRVLYFSKGGEKLIVVVRQIRNGSRAELQLDTIDRNDLLLKGKLQDPGY